MSDGFWEKAWDKTTDFLEKAWNKTSGVAKSVYKGTKDLIFSKDQPDPLEDPDDREEAQSYLDEVPPDMVGYYDYLRGQYEILLSEIKAELIKYEKKLAELKQIEKDIHDKKLDRLAVRSENQEKIAVAKNNSRFFEDDSPFHKDHTQDEKKAREEVKNTQLPDENPLIKDDFIDNELTDKVPNGGPINLKIYITHVKSKLKILENEVDYLQEQFDRSEYWYKESLEEQEEKDSE